MSEFIALLTGEALKPLPDFGCLPQQSIVKVDLFNEPQPPKVEPQDDGEDRRCTKCKEWFPPTEFYLMKRPTGTCRMSECKSCRKANVAAYQAKHADQIKKQRAKQRAKKRAAKKLAAPSGASN